MWQRLRRWGEVTGAVLEWVVWFILCAVMLAGDVQPPRDMPGRVQPYVRDIEFDFAGWMASVLVDKLQQAGLHEQTYLAAETRTRLVRDYFDLVARLEQTEADQQAIYADPAVTDKAAATAELSAQAAGLRAQIGEMQPLVESILQEQISVVLAEQGMTSGGQPVPPVAFRFTKLPLALIVSPRNEIKQAANMPVRGGLPVEKQVALEDQVARELDVSTLVVALGGIGTYPTMVYQSSYLNWTASTCAHEWAHNYLTLRPLGMNYETSPQLRTMNETAAEIVGNEIGALLVARYYPNRVPAPPPFPNVLLRDQPPEAAQAAPEFNFDAEMHATRVQADALLAQNQVAEAEAYMETRRQFFWQNGYRHIRKLNQAYFAFYGAYAAGGGGGAQGMDPVGPAVTLLRRRSPSLQAFVNTLAGFTSFEQLQGYLAEHSSYGQ